MIPPGTIKRCLRYGSYSAAVGGLWAVAGYVLNTEDFGDHLVNRFEIGCRVLGSAVVGILLGGYLGGLAAFCSVFHSKRTFFPCLLSLLVTMLVGVYFVTPHTKQEAAEASPVGTIVSQVVVIFTIPAIMAVVLAFLGRHSLNGESSSKSDLTLASDEVDEACQKRTN